MDKTISNLDIDLEEWELLPNWDHYKSVSSKVAPSFYSRTIVDLDYFAPSRTPLGSVANSSKTDGQEERIIMEIRDAKASQLPMDGIMNSSPSLKKVDGGGFETQWNTEEFEGEKKKMIDKKSKESGVQEKEFLCSDIEGRECWDGIGINLWGWRFRVAGALSTIGVAAATICVFVLGRRDRQKHQHQKIQFKIYSDDKNLKQIMHHATRLNQSILATRGLTMTNADISFGGYYAAGL